MFNPELFRSRVRKDESAPGCHNCTSACCRDGIVIELTDAEAVFLREGGTELRPRWGPDMPAKKEYNDWEFLGDCGFLEKDASGKTFCSIHENPNRPLICSVFEEGDYGCLNIRRHAKVDTK